MKRTAGGDVMGPRALNRALLARQMLLERSAMPVADAIAHLVGLQAQIPADPYFGLWSRLAAFRPKALSDLIATRKAVRMVAMRGTIHLLAAGDALLLRPLVQPALSRIVAANAFGKATKGIDLAAVVAAGREAFAAGPLTLAELREVLAPRWPEHDPTALGYLVHYHLPLIQIPPRGLWGKGGAPRLATAEAWLGRPVVGRPSAETVVLRYLAAFGPASVADAQAWAGLTRLAPVFEAVRPKLAVFRDESGRELFDLPDAPRPDAATPVPPRFLPTYDNVTLGFTNRDRIIRPDVAPPRALPRNGGARTFLLDGFVAGFWKLAQEPDGAALILEPFRPLAKKDMAALSAEGRRLARFALPDAKIEVRLGEAY